MNGWGRWGGEENARKVTFNWCAKGRLVNRASYSSGRNWPGGRAEWTKHAAGMFLRFTVTGRRRAEVMDGGE